MVLKTELLVRQIADDGTLLRSGLESFRAVRTESGSNCSSICVASPASAGVAVTSWAVGLFIFTVPNTQLR